MHKVFDVSLMDDVSAIIEKANKGSKILPEIIKTTSKQNFVVVEDSWWRMLEYVPGVSFDKFNKERAESAGRLTGDLHKKLLDFNYDFKYSILNFHNVDFTISLLKKKLEKNKKNNKKYESLVFMAKEIFDFYKELSGHVDFSKLPRRIVHGDLKASNFRFDENTGKAIAILDLDTFMYDPLAKELGDALRSWCQKGNKYSVEGVGFDIDIYKRALEGYFSSFKEIEKEEKDSVPFGLKVITLDLAARFIIDAFDESYFVLNKDNFENLYEQNKKRAANQLAYYKEITKIL